MDHLVDLHSHKNVLSKGTAVVSFRSGQVLSRDTILKDDHLLGGIRHDLEPRLLDVPNFRKAQMPGMEIYASAQASVSGIVAVLTMLGAAPSRAAKDPQAPPPAPRRIVWINAREEPLVYLNGRPYTLREQEFPLRNIRRYSGVDASRVEQMEQRLKADIVIEAAQYNGLILIHEEQSKARSSMTFFIATMIVIL